MEEKTFIRVYTRSADPERYPDGLARSIHMSLIRENGGRTEEKALNLGCGVLFADGLIDENDCISSRGLRDPLILRDGEGWLIFADRCLEDGTAEDNGDLVQMWHTDDFCGYESRGMAPRPAGEAFAETPVPEEIAERILKRWGDPCGYPFRVERDAPEGLPCPLVKGWGDPVFLYRKQERKYYFIATCDNRDDIGLYIREGDTLAELFRPDAEEHLILGFDEEKGFVQTFWAPEFHEIGGELYLFFAVSGKAWGPHCHIMKLKPGGKLTDPAGWTEPVPVTMPDGSPLQSDGITLDMTVIHTRRPYAVWSYRRHIGTPLDTGSMLYIAPLDEKAPRRLAGDPVLLSRPLYGWENVAGTINNEGPYALIRNGRVYLGYSGGSANAWTYVIGLLTADASAELSDPACWEKSGTPMLNFASVPGDLGPGHHSFFEDAEGGWWIAYHTVRSYEDHLRCPVMHRLRFPDEDE